jgi:hypothetical protein
MTSLPKSPADSRPGEPPRIDGPPPAPGQGLVGPPCAWCDHAATTEIEIEPARYRAKTVADPHTGERRTAKEMVAREIVIPACDDHKRIKDRQPPKPKRGKKRPGPDQLRLL